MGAVGPLETERVHETACPTSLVSGWVLEHVDELASSGGVVAGAGGPLA